MNTPAGDAMVGRPAAHAEASQLRSGDHTVLACRDRRNREVGVVRPTFALYDLVTVGRIAYDAMVTGKLRRGRSRWSRHCAIFATDLRGGGGELAVALSPPS